MSVLQCIRYKMRQNKLYYDTDMLLNFFISLCSNISTALYGIVAIFSTYIFFVYKSQTNIHILLPIPEQELFEAFIYVAVVLKVSICFHYSTNLLLNY